MRTHLQNNNRIPLFSPCYNVLKIFIVHDGIRLAQEGRNHRIPNSVFLLLKPINILNELAFESKLAYLRIRIGKSSFVIMRVAHVFLWGKRTVVGLP